MKVSFQHSATGIGMVVAMAVLLCLPSVAFAASVLGVSQSFSVLANATVTNSGPTTIGLDLGVNAGSALTGFPPGVVLGTTHIGDAVSLAAQNAETNAFTVLNLLTPFTLLPVELGGTTLLPGIYRFTTDAQLTGTTPLTLDFNNQANAQFVFQISRALTTGPGSSISVINGTSTDAIYFLVGSSATLGTTTHFAGNILASTSISLATGATIDCGRAFAQTGAVTLLTNTIGGNCSSTLPGGDFGSGGFSGGPVTSAAGVPEPGNFLLLGMSLAGLAAKFSARKK